VERRKKKQKNKKQKATRATLTTIKLDTLLIRGGDAEMLDHLTPGITLLKGR
jgi:hypothetical protein